MSSPLLATKFHVPPPRPDRVPRPRLIEALNSALRQGHKLILIAAPAGFGKTTLVADWLWHTHLSAAWLWLDPGDNDPSSFWRYVIAALQTADKTLGRTAQAALEMPPPSPQGLPLESLIAALINDLAAAARPIVLVLDDYHVIDAELVHTSLNYFLDHLPEQVHVVITTRVDPPLTLFRRRGRAELTELRALDLRFSVPEAHEFLNICMGLNLPTDDIAALENRTEGWIAGLQLAALSLHEQADRHAFVTAFAGDDRYIADYLLEEILRQQPSSIQTFLLHSSILERLCAPLCEAITGETGSQDILTYLEQSNLFVVPLDNRRTWYRYHHLFADLLRRRLKQTMEAPAWMALYRRASAWYEREGLVAEAVSQALAAPDWLYAADLLDRHVLAVFFRSETMLAHNWLKTLPEPVLHTHALLCAVYANTIAHTGAFQIESLRRCEDWLQAADEALTAGTDRPENDLTRNFIALSRAYLALWRHDAPQTVIALAQQALAGLPPAAATPVDPNTLRFRSGLTNNLGMSHMALGNEEEASRAFAEARQIGEACGDLLNTYAAAHAQCTILRRKGRLPEAAHLCQHVLESIGRAEQPSEPTVPYAGIVWVALGQILLEWNDLEAAELALIKGLKLSELMAAPDTQANGRVALAYLRQARGEAATALETLDRAEQGLQSAQTYVAAHRVRLWLMQGRLDAAAHWARGRALTDAAGVESLTLARVLIAQRRAAFQLSPGSSADPGSLQPFLERQLQVAKDAGWVERMIELLVLQALACQVQNSALAALDSLERALALAQPGGYVRLFVDEGPPMASLLRKMKERKRAETGSRMAEYLDRLLDAFRDEESRAATRHSSVAIPQPLVEPLSARELQVLRLLASGASNAEIAQELVITLNTAKKHVTHIFEKLGVTHRADAIAHARELGLVA